MDRGGGGTHPKAPIDAQFAILMPRQLANMAAPNMVAPANSLLHLAENIGTNHTSFDADKRPCYKREYTAVVVVVVS